mgnify:CR=1 FL=1
MCSPRRVRRSPEAVVEQQLPTLENNEDVTVVPFLDREWDGDIVTGDEAFITAVGSGTTYPDYKPAPFIVSSDCAPPLLSVSASAFRSACSRLIATR